MVLESAEVLAKGGKVAEAVEALLATPRAPGHKRRAVEYLSTAFWQYQSFGMDHPATDLKVVSELLELAGTLRNDMDQLKAREVCLAFSCGITLTVEKYSLRCSKQGTKTNSKHFVFYIPNSSKKEITPRLCCASIESLPLRSLPHKVLSQLTPDPSFLSTLPTSSFWIV